MTVTVVGFLVCSAMSNFFFIFGISVIMVVKKKILRFKLEKLDSKLPKTFLIVSESHCFMKNDVLVTFFE